MSWLLLGIVFVLGTAIGSFVNVLISRTLAGEGFIKGRSRCDHCGKTLQWYDLIPLLSFLANRGRSRCCRKKLTWRHPIVEALFGLLMVWWLMVGFVFFRLAAEPLTVVQPLFWLLTGVLLLGVAVADWEYGVILMPLVWLGLGLSILYRLILLGYGMFQGKDLMLAILAALGYAGFLYLLRVLTKGQGMGEGDPYLALWLGFLLGWPRVVSGALAAFIIGAAVGVVLLISRRKQWKSSIPFGPFMVIGAMWGLLFRI